jgi:iron complex transport system substrate-binding protein
MRICSLTPSGTEIVCALGLADQLIGVSHRCNYPPAVMGRPVVSQLLVRQASSGEIDTALDAFQEAGHPIYELDAALMRRLAPDVILTQEICDVCAVPASLAEELARGLAREPRLVSVTASTLEEVLGNVERLGVVTGRSAEARELLARLRGRIQRVAETAAGARTRPGVVFLEWLDPPWCAGRWTPELIALAGGTDVLGRTGQRSRKVSWSEVVASAPEIVFLSPCGFTIERTLEEVPRVTTLPEWSALPAVRAGRVYVCDGELYSRYGPRIVDGLEALARVIHPELFPGSPPGHLVRPAGG